VRVWWSFFARGFKNYLERRQHEIFRYRENIKPCCRLSGKAGHMAGLFVGNSASNLWNIVQLLPVY
jgi:hypothetical protein